MPANEQTWRDQNLLHQIFAVSGVVLLGVTIWMFAADHNREWKDYQQTSRDVERSMNRWRQLQTDVEANRELHEELMGQLLAVRSQAIPRGTLVAFQDEFRAYVATQNKAFPEDTFQTLDADAKRLEELAAEAARLRQEH
jgi:hypothetical protein